MVKMIWQVQEPWASEELHVTLVPSGPSLSQSQIQFLFNNRLSLCIYNLQLGGSDNTHLIPSSADYIVSSCPMINPSLPTMAHQYDKNFYKEQLSQIMAEPCSKILMISQQLTHKSLAEPKNNYYQTLALRKPLDLLDFITTGREDCCRVFFLGTPLQMNSFLSQ